MPSKNPLPIDIIVDARMLHHSGIGTYLRGLLSELRQDPFFENHSLGLALPTRMFSEINGKLSLQPFNVPIYSIHEQIEYPFQLRHSRLWHAPHYNAPLFKKKVRLVVTIHDLIHWIFRKEFFSSTQALYAEFLFKRAIQQADKIIAVSGQTRDDLIRYFKAPPEKIRVIYEGVSDVFFNTPSQTKCQEFLKKYSLPEHFFLFVGLIKPHKNLARLIHVFKKLKSAKRLASDLVIVGKKDRKYPKGYENLKNLKTGEGIHYMPSIDSREELALLYASAKSLIHPSLYEGFGLTCLESMAMGTPVIVSKAASLPEVAGEAGYYIDPHSDDSIRLSLMKLEDNEKLRWELSEKGKLRARQFSWVKTARETIEVYKEVLNS